MSNLRTLQADDAKNYVKHFSSLAIVRSARTIFRAAHCLHQQSLRTIPPKRRKKNGNPNKKRNVFSSKECCACNRKVGRLRNPLSRNALEYVDESSTTRGT